MSDADLAAGMEQIVADIANDPNVRRQTQEEVRQHEAWLREYEQSKEPITKKEAWNIINAIRSIPVYRGDETNKLLAEIRNELFTIRWGVTIIAILIIVKLWHG